MGGCRLVSFLFLFIDFLSSVVGRLLLSAVSVIFVFGLYVLVSASVSTV